MSMTSMVIPSTANGFTESGYLRGRSPVPGAAHLPRSRPQAVTPPVARRDARGWARPVDHHEVARTLARQDGVISRRQVISAGGTDNDIQRLVRRREWARVFQGVYVAHTGPLSEVQRAWAAVLYAWPAALAG